MVPFYLDGAAGKLFCVYFPSPNTDKKSAVIFFPAFAEEMNKSRISVSNQARILQSMGQSVLLFDLFGTGDSEGDISQTSWDIWLADSEVALNWLCSQGYEKIHFWSLRTGALLLFEILPSVTELVHSLILWQPVIKGSGFIKQFLRMRIVADMVGTKNTTISDLWSRLENDGTLEIAGYTMPYELLKTIDRSTVDPPSEFKGLVNWFEILPMSMEKVGKATQNTVEKWVSKGVNLNLQTVKGDKFWSTTEIVVIPELWDETANSISVTV